MEERRVVYWPDGVSHPDPWSDPCWESLDDRGRYPDLWAAWNDRHAHPDGVGVVAARYGLTAPQIEDRNRPDWEYPAPSLADLARITTDTWPAAGMDAPEIVLGPRSLFASRFERLIAVAGCAFVWTDGWPQSSFRNWCRGKPIPDPTTRATLRAVGLAPWALWRVVRQLDGLVELEDATGLGEFYQPRGWVQIVGQAPTGEGLAARVYRTPDGWVAHCALDLPRLPERSLVDDWLTTETWLARTVQPGITREALLRKRPILVRKAMEHGVLRGTSG